MASERSDLDSILERNRAFTRGRSPEPLPAVHPIDLLIVSCYDPRLDRLLLPALGVAPGEVFLLRTAGAIVQPTGDPIRTIAVSAFLFDVRKVLVVGHSSCRMASFSTSSFVDAFRARGIIREAFGADDLRQWAGAIASPTAGVQASVAAVRSAPFLPADLQVSGLVLDDTTGELAVVPHLAERTAEVRYGISGPVDSIVDRGERELAARGVPEVALGRAAEPPERAGPAGRPASATRAGSRETRELVRAVESIGEFVRTLRSNADWLHRVEAVHNELRRQRHPLKRLALLEQFIKQAAGSSHEVTQSFERVKQHLTAARKQISAQDLEKLIARLAGQDTT